MHFISGFLLLAVVTANRNKYLDFMEKMATNGKMDNYAALIGEGKKGNKIFFC